jgi:hypothetical protein
MSDRITRWVAPHTNRWFEAGAHCSNPVPGDVIIVRHPTFIASMIAFGQWLLSFFEPELRNKYTWGNHTALIVMSDGTQHAHNSMVTFPKGVFLVSEMGMWGHGHRLLSDYQSRLYCVVHFDVPQEDINRVLAADEAFRSIDYGFVQYPFLIMNIFTGLPISISFGTAMFCSEEVTMLGMNIYWISDRAPSDVFPAHISLWVDAEHK